MNISFICTGKWKGLCDLLFLQYLLSCGSLELNHNISKVSLYSSVSSLEMSFLRWGIVHLAASCIASNKHRCWINLFSKHLLRIQSVLSTELGGRHSICSLLLHSFLWFCDWWCFRKVSIGPDYLRSPSSKLSLKSQSCPLADINIHVQMPSKFIFTKILRDII